MAEAGRVLRFRRVRVPQVVETRKCEVHGEVLVEEDVPIIYGLPRFPWGYEEALTEEFPHSGTRVLGGCCVRDEEPKVTRYWLCRSCRKAEKKWRRRHPEGVSWRSKPTGVRSRSGFLGWLESLLRRRK